MIYRRNLEDQIRKSLRAYPVTTLLGPRQCGKTTVARAVAREQKAEWFDCEDPLSLARLAEPMTALAGLRGLVVIDEIQFRPELFPVLRVLADRRPQPCRFLILGSAAPHSLRQGRETLAGRISFIDMAGFDASEVGPKNRKKLWWRGGFPKPFMARTDGEAREWHTNFFRTFLERDIQALGTIVPAGLLRRAWTMIANGHSDPWNASNIAQSLGIAHTSASRYLDLLCDSLVVRRLQPWHENLSKREVKSPKVYVRDTGLLHALLQIPDFRALEGHPKLGASWEGFVIEEVIRLAGAPNVFFWGTHSGAELDALVNKDGKRIGIEVKYGDAPSRTKSMGIAMADLKLDALYVVYPGAVAYSIGERMRVIPFEDLPSILSRPRGRAILTKTAS